MFVIKRHKSPFWVCCYRNTDGRWLKKTTKQTDRTQAWKFCVQIQRAADEGRAGALTEATARDIISEIVESTTGKAIQQWTVRKWFAHWLEIKQKTSSPKTMQKYRQVLRDFEESLGPRANLPLVHITSEDALRYRNAILEAGRGDMTANQSMKVVGAAFNAALKQDHIKRNPCSALDSLAKKARAAATKRATFTSAQVAKLARAAEGDWKAAILFGYYTGARLSDVANMRWEAIDLDADVIRFTPSKTGKEIALPLHPELRRALLRLPRGIAKAPLFPSLAGRGTGGAHGLSGRFAAIMERAGIQRKMMSVVKGGREIADLSFHSLRHSFTSALANANVAEEVRMKLTGHSTRAVHGGYTHHEMDLLRVAIGALPKISAR
jgi:integrase